VCNCSLFSEPDAKMHCRTAATLNFLNFGEGVVFWLTPLRNGVLLKLETSSGAFASHRFICMFVVLQVCRIICSVIMIANIFLALATAHPASIRLPLYVCCYM
jgi:hypothetical protein